MLVVNDVGLPVANIRASEWIDPTPERPASDVTLPDVLPREKPASPAVPPAPAFATQGVLTGIFRAGVGAPVCGSRAGVRMISLTAQYGDLLTAASPPHATVMPAASTPRFSASRAPVVTYTPVYSAAAPAAGTPRGSSHGLALCYAHCSGCAAGHDDGDDDVAARVRALRARVRACVCLILLQLGSRAWGHTYSAPSSPAAIALRSQLVAVSRVCAHALTHTHAPLVIQAAAWQHVLQACAASASALAAVLVLHVRTDAHVCAATDGWRRLDASVQRALVYSCVHARAGACECTCARVRLRSGVDEGESRPQGDTVWSSTAGATARCVAVHVPVCVGVSTCACAHTRVVVGTHSGDHVCSCGRSPAQVCVRATIMLLLRETSMLRVRECACEDGLVCSHGREHVAHAAARGLTENPHLSVGELVTPLLAVARPATASAATSVAMRTAPTDAAGLYALLATLQTMRRDA